MKKPNYMSHFILGAGIMFTAMYSTFADGGDKVTKEEFKIKALTKERHPEAEETKSAGPASASAGKKLVEITFAGELAEGDMRGL